MSLQKYVDCFGGAAKQIEQNVQFKDGLEYHPDITCE